MEYDCLCTQLGTYTELIEKKGAFAEFLKRYATKEQAKLEYGGLNIVTVIAFFLASFLIVIWNWRPCQFFARSMSPTVLILKGDV